MPQGFCVPPFCWNLTYNFANIQLIVIKPADVPTWNKGVPVPAAMFPALVAAFQAQLNAQARIMCGNNCVCVRLHKRAITAMLGPQKIGPHPGGLTDIYMDGITVTGWWGLCCAKGFVKIKKGDEWIPVEDLPASDILKSSSSPGSGGGGHKKKGKKGKKGKKKRRTAKRRR